MTRPKATSSPDATDSRATSATVAQDHREGDQPDVRLAMTFEELLGDDEMTDESASDMIEAVRAWRDVTSRRSLD